MITLKNTKAARSAPNGSAGGLVKKPLTNIDKYVKKPAYNPALPRKVRLLWSQSFAKLYQLFKDPSTIKPQALPEHMLLALGYTRLKRPLPRLKGNVQQTMKEILTIFMKTWNNTKHPINLAIFTNRASLAKRCGNWDPQTAYYHILTLIEHGFLRAKVRTARGLQLLLNPEYLVFDGPLPFTPLGATLAPATAAAPSEVPTAPQGPEMVHRLQEMAAELMAKFSTEPPKRT